MIKMLIIADDFTGALDTGVKFSAAGAKTKVVTDTGMDFSAPGEEEVLVLCAPTRHLPPAQAYDMIRAVVRRAAAAGVRCIYKKTDSALRGNVGAELQAVLDGSGEKALCFVPALPAMNRVTVNGVHYIDGLPVDRSVFGQDPFEPVTVSSVSDLIHLQSDVPVQTVTRRAAETFQAGESPCVYVFDCVTREDMDATARVLARRGCLKVLAGCAGLAESLPPYLGVAGVSEVAPEPSDGRMIVACGSVNPISTGQMEYGERCGSYRRVHIPAEQLLGDGSLEEGAGKVMMDYLWDAYLQAGHLMIDSLQGGEERVLEGTAALPLEQIRQRISRRMGQILKALMDRGAHGRIMVIGGDTLLAFLEAIRCRELTPVCEMQPGVVLSRVTYRNRQYELLAKSGGFGEEDLLVTLLGGAAALLAQPAVS